MTLAVFQQVDAPRKVVLYKLPTAGATIDARKDAGIRRRINDPVRTRKGIDVTAARRSAWRTAMPAFCRVTRFSSLPGRMKLSNPKISARAKHSRRRNASVLPTKPQMPLIIIRMRKDRPVVVVRSGDMSSTGNAKEREVSSGRARPRGFPLFDAHSCSHS